jgi:hypothetical protein
MMPYGVKEFYPNKKKAGGKKKPPVKPKNKKNYRKM